MIAEVLSTGDEVLLGDIVDTNAAFLCRELRDLGINVSRISTVGDRIKDLVSAIETIGARADVCLVTGGLGPTADDLTAEACALAAGVALERNKDALSSMAAYFERRGWAMTPENEKQVMLPKGAFVLENDNGTAPGFGMIVRACTFYFMPGVPGEMRRMFAQKVSPRFATGAEREFDIRRFTIFGLPESQVGGRLKEFERLFPCIRLGFRANFPVIEVKLVGKDSMDGAAAWVAQQLGHKVVSFHGRGLAAEVGEYLLKQRQTLSVAESCTGGLIAHQITDVPGASAYFFFSGVTYANAAKVGVLGVSSQTLDEKGAVSEETARQMAEGAKKAGGTDWAVATTGIAGPSGGSDEKPVGTVCIGVAGPFGVTARRFVLDTGDRSKNKALFAATALNMLRQKLAESVD